jgi:hypothetical protein
VKGIVTGPSFISSTELAGLHTLPMPDLRGEAASARAAAPLPPQCTLC